MNTGFWVKRQAVSIVFVCALLLLLPQKAFSLDKIFVGARAMGMAGSNVASVNDNSAQYYNPAAFGFYGLKAKKQQEEAKAKKKQPKEQLTKEDSGVDNDLQLFEKSLGSEEKNEAVASQAKQEQIQEKRGQDAKSVKAKKKAMSPEGRLAVDNNNLANKDWRFEASTGVGIRLHEDLSELLDDLNDIDTTVLSKNSVQSEADLKNLVKVTDLLNRLDNPGNAVTMDLTSNISFGFGHLAVGAMAFSQGSARVSNVDTANLGISGAVNLNTEINNITLAGDDGQIKLFTTDQQTQLSAAGLNSNAIQQLDYAARQAGIDQESLQGTIDILATVVQLTTTGTGGDLENNNTSAVVQGFGYYEIPVSYGRALNENFAIGANIKPLVGRVYGQEIVVFKKDTGDIIEDFDQHYKQTTTFGIDLGALYRIKRFQFGLVARNINAPEFKGPTVNGRTFSDVTMDPSLTAGAAFIPYEGFTLEMDYDLIKTETAFPGYDIQNISTGVEWMFLRFLTLRAGAYKNVAESDIGWVYTGGIGINMLGMRLDISGAFSKKEGSFDDDNFPVEARAMAQLSLDF